MTLRRATAPREEPSRVMNCYLIDHVGLVHHVELSVGGSLLEIVRERLPADVDPPDVILDAFLLHVRDDVTERVP